MECLDIKKSDSIYKNSSNVTITNRSSTRDSFLSRLIGYMDCGLSTDIESSVLSAL